MANFFEELMMQNSQLTEGLVRQSSAKKTESAVKKYPVSKFKFESRRVFEETEFDELDDQFAVDPEEAEEDEVVLVIDPQTTSEEEIPEDAAEEMIGDMVYKCPICGANYVCDCDAVETESIDVDENGVPTECPICGDDAEQILIGEIAPVEGAGEETELPPVDAEDAEDEEEDKEEVEDDFADEEGIPEFEEEEEEEIIEDSLKRRPRRMESKKSIRKQVKEGPPWERDRDDLPSVSKVRRGEYYVGGYEDDIFDHMSKIRSAGCRIAEEDDGYGYAVAGSKEDLEYLYSSNDGFFTESDLRDLELMESKRSLRRKKRVKEDLEDDIDDVAEVGVVDVVDETCPECGEAPCACPTVAIDADNVNLYLDDKRFESLVTKMIRENYHDNPTFKITKVSSKGSKIKVEYVVREGRKTTKGRMVAEGFNRNARVLNLKFKDKGVFTESFTKRPAIVVECVRIRNKVIPTKLAYDYKVKVNESLYRVVGKVGKTENFTKATRR